MQIFVEEGVLEDVEDADPARGVLFENHAHEGEAVFGYKFGVSDCGVDLGRADGTI